MHAQFFLPATINMVSFGVGVHHVGREVYESAEFDLLVEEGHVLILRQDLEPEPEAEPEADAEPEPEPELEAEPEQEIEPDPPTKTKRNK